MLLYISRSLILSIGSVDNFFFRRSARLSLGVMTVVYPLPSEGLGTVFPIVSAVFTRQQGFKASLTRLTAWACEMLYRGKHGTHSSTSFSVSAAGSWFSPACLGGVLFTDAQHTRHPRHALFVAPPRVAYMQYRQPLTVLFSTGRI